MAFRYPDFLGLKIKKFWRSKNLTKNLFVKIFLFFSYAMLLLYVLGFGVGMYFLLKESFPEATNYVEKLNDYVYVFFLIGFSFLMTFNAFKPDEMKPYLLLPLSRKRVLKYYLINHLLNPVFLILSLWPVVVGIVFIQKGYDAAGIIKWIIAVTATLFVLNLIAWLNERSTFIGFLSSILLIAAITTTHIAPKWFKPVSRWYYAIYEGNIFYFLLIVISVVTVMVFLYHYMLRNYYLDGKIRLKNNTAVKDVKLTFMEKFGITGAFIQNDIKLILRNTRTKMIIQSSLFFLLFAAFIFYAPIYKNNDFMYLFVAVSLSAAFLLNFGSFVPAWDSEYFNLMVSQSISYRDYLEAKWWLLVLSVVVMTLLSVPLIYFGWDIFKMILAFAVFNAGLNIYIVLLTGLLNTTPIKLNEKVSAFGGGQSFNGRLFLLSLLRFAIPILMFFGLKRFFDTDTVLIIIAITGLIGFALKNHFLNALARLYIKRKYTMVEAYSSTED